MICLRMKRNSNDKIIHQIIYIMKRISLLLLCVSLIACTEELISVESIVLEPDTLTLRVGESENLVAFVMPVEAHNPTVSWKSSNEEVASVTSLDYSGLCDRGHERVAKVDAIAPGEVTITAITEDGEKTAICNLKILDNSIPVNSISIEPSELTISKGSSSYLSVVFDPYDATNKNLVWTTSDSTIVTINDNRVYGVALGEATIKAETEDGKHCAYCHVIVDIPRISQTLEFGPVSLKLEDVTTSSAKVYGTVDIDRLAGYDMDSGGIGILYSHDYSRLDVDHAKKLELTTFGPEGEFKFDIEDLSYGTTYYYTIYLYKNGVLQYAAKKNFITENVEFTVEEVTTTKTTAKFTGITNLYSYPVGVSYGVLISEIEDFVADTQGVRQKNFWTDNQTCGGLVEYLNYGTTYYYRTFIEQFNKYVYGDVQKFTTQVVDVSLEVDNVTQTKAVIRGYIDVMPEEMISVGVTYWKTGHAENKRSCYAEIDELRNFRVELNNLLPSTEYQYCYYTYQNYEYVYGEISQTFTTEPVPFEITAKNITQTTAIFEGQVELTEPESVEVGIRYSTKKEGLDEKWRTPAGSDTVPDYIVQAPLSNLLSEDGLYSLFVEGLEWGQTYYYCYYLKQGGYYVFGEIQEFVTQSVIPQLEIDNITQTTATFKGNLSLTEPDAIEFGVCYALNERECYPSYSSAIVKSLSGSLELDGNFTYKIDQLFPSQRYFYRFYLKQGKKYHYGEICEFTTLNPYESQYDLDVASAIDLSSFDSANCYIVSDKGLYKFKAVKGNSSESVGNIASVSILWETLGTSTELQMCDLISAFCYRDGFIAFQTADAFREGNALLAAKDASGNILWSWHIWFTDQPRVLICSYGAGTVMDRNLGATSDASGDVGAFGLLYQWGRKDPFLGALSTESYSSAKSTITWPTAVSSNTTYGTIEYATANPTTFITYNSTNHDWYYTGSATTDNTRWTTSAIAKSVYDPCPAGWRVPDGGEDGLWFKALGSSSSYTVNYNRDAGLYLIGWYPATGFLDKDDGLLARVGEEGKYWSCSPCDNYYAYSLEFSYWYKSDVYTSDSEYRARGCSVRCVQE